MRRVDGRTVPRVTLGGLVVIPVLLASRGVGMDGQKSAEVLGVYAEIELSAEVLRTFIVDGWNFPL